MVLCKIGDIPLKIVKTKSDDGVTIHFVVTKNLVCTLKLYIMGLIIMQSFYNNSPVTTGYSYKFPLYYDELYKNYSADYEKYKDMIPQDMVNRNDFGKFIEENVSTFFAGSVAAATKFIHDNM